LLPGSEWKSRTHACPCLIFLVVRGRGKKGWGQYSVKISTYWCHPFKSTHYALDITFPHLPPFKSLLRSTPRLIVEVNIQRSEELRLDSIILAILAPLFRVKILIPLFFGSWFTVLVIKYRRLLNHSVLISHPVLFSSPAAVWKIDFVHRGGGGDTWVFCRRSGSISFGASDS